MTFLDKYVSVTFQTSLHNKIDVLERVLFFLLLFDLNSLFIPDIAIYSPSSSFLVFF